MADPTRRDILKRVSRSKGALSVSEIADAYHRQMSLAAVSKHLRVLEKARLVTKQRRGKQTLVSLSPPALHSASDYLRQFERLWEERFDRLEEILKEE
ncbi:MAG: metalloregulator ArsR/SmtB family transcription factor [Chloroflexi bacterium]|nr:metalloregulator ArsR/SmtB family transcription factor [Chloroflexota bacterium]